MSAHYTTLEFLCTGEWNGLGNAAEPRGRGGDIISAIRRVRRPGGISGGRTRYVAPVGCIEAHRLT